MQSKKKIQRLHHTSFGIKKKLIVVALYVDEVGSKVICVTYFFVIKCSNKGVTNVKNPTTEHRAIIKEVLPMVAASLIMIGCAINPATLELRENTFTAFICGVKGP